MAVWKPDYRIMMRIRAASHTCLRWSPDSCSSYYACHMIGSVNMSFPSNMTLWHPWRSIDDPRWSLTTLTRDPQGSKQPVPVVTRESAPVSVVWDAVLGFLSSAGGHEILCAHSGGFTLPDMAQKSDTLSLLSQIFKSSWTLRQFRSWSDKKILWVRWFSSSPGWF